MSDELTVPNFSSTANQSRPDRPGVANGSPDAADSSLITHHVSPSDSDSALSTQHSSLPNPIDEIKARDLESQIVEVLRTVYDPEIPVNIYEMGLIYTIRATADGTVFIAMTLTSPACPVAGSLPIEVEQKIRAIPGVTSAKVEIVWDPPWTPEKMSEAAKLQLGFM
jgi:FeS assembly SUF system protein